MAFSSFGTDVMEQIHEYHTENPKKNHFQNTTQYTLK